ncbi:Hypothetical protein SMAX5B_022569, partial [Scophthalmus maximus]
MCPGKPVSGGVQESKGETQREKKERWPTEGGARRDGGQEWRRLEEENQEAAGEEK